MFWTFRRVFLLIVLFLALAILFQLLGFGTDTSSIDVDGRSGAESAGYRAGYRWAFPMLLSLLCTVAISVIWRKRARRAGR